MWGLYSVPKKWLWGLGIVGALVVAGIVVVVFALLFWSSTEVAASWPTMDSRERDGLIIVLILMSWLTRSKTECKCSGKCGKP